MATDPQTSPPPDTASEQPAASSTSVEMNDLNLREHGQGGDAVATSQGTVGTSPLQSTTSPETVTQQTGTRPTDAVGQEDDDTEAIGPLAMDVTPMADTSSGPSLQITLLLTSGARHPWVIDQKYLKKRSVEAEEDDPYNISVYTLKELIWRDWRTEWEARPSNPSYIRLISFGRMLEDKAPLKECRFSNGSPNVVHMTIRPQEIPDEEENTKTGKGRVHDGEERDAGCRCIIL